MTDEDRPSHGAEGGEEAIEDLEAPAAAQRDVAGGFGSCRPTNRCAPADTVVHCPEGVTQFCIDPTCKVTKVGEAEA